MHGVSKGPHTHPKSACFTSLHIIVSLILVLPATNATSERSFSTLQRIKTFLRSTMTQVRLNNAMLLHIYSNMTESLNLIDIGNDFIFGSEHRLTLFGKFSCND